MMRTWLIVVLFLGALLLDGMILPGLFGFKESFLTIFFIIFILLYHELSLRSLIIGTLLSAAAEFYWGLKTSILILPLFASAGVYFLLNSFFNTRNKVFLVVLGAVMFVVFWEASVLISKII